MKWAFAFAGDASAAVQPSIVGGRVFVGSAPGRVFALSLQEGCAYWTFDADAQVRTAVAVGEAGGAVAAFFGDVGGNVYSVEAASGRLRWKRRADTHPLARVSGTPAFHAGRLYVPVSSIEEVVGAIRNTRVAPSAAAWSPSMRQRVRSPGERTSLPRNPSRHAKTRSEPS